jgi:phosphoserine aminotransferase
MQGGRNRAHTFNFGAGPATLPDAVLRKAQEELLNWRDSGMSVMEMSHRGAEFISILRQTEMSLRRLLHVPESYKVLFLQGGGMGAFASVPLNLLGNKTTADYLITGAWSARAANEARKYCSVNVVADTADSDYTRLPERATWKLNNQAAYFHYCDNETVHGVEFPQDFFSKAENGVEVPIVADMSSNYFSRPVDVSKYAVIYGGAQKNVGIAGLTIVLAREDMLAINDQQGSKWKDFVPSVMDWKKMSENESCLNTPPAYSIYLAGLCFDWMLDEGGIEVIGERNLRKSAKLYAALEQSDFYYLPVMKEARSRMNVVFRILVKEDREIVRKRKEQSEGMSSDCGSVKLRWDEKLETKFAKEAEGRGLLSLKGYRTVGGMRASLYNAMTEEGVDRLIEFLAEFEAKNNES